ncbi:hypothetical protein BJ684DRAFT_17852 [Piptocephalis cylindrospora]|uniref:VPS37 C-terminal domain-containing protein n=1 Tax=Piptocephalis cylindrospora TaxID=1907219 RepID=A0A4P9XYT8_9FUNG|nr:hypothetical protein BJ684DRAFT_17852 [Piptocephalis cylindrospora]|eukprot:RKP11567.1 hypothetical protein BJ684DRAFT_17852 [Piptocephalis cylindrospora]
MSQGKPSIMDLDRSSPGDDRVGAEGEEADMAVLDTLTEEELQEILDEEEALELLIETMPSVQHVRTVMEELTTGNAAIARRTRQAHEDMKQLREQVSELTDVLGRTREHLSHLDAQAQIATSRFSRHAVADELLSMARSADEESEACLGEMEGSEGLEGWVDRYIPLRENYHRLDLLSERVKHMAGPR